MHDARDRNAGLWIEHNDRLYVAAYSSVASLSVMFSGYFRRENGEIQEYAVTVNPTSDRAVTANTQIFGAGFLLSCVASLASGNANRGQCYVRAQIQRSTGTPAIKLHNVVGGYATDDYSPSFPYGKIEGPLEGRGMIRSITGSDPAAGAEVSETVPTGARWRLAAFTALLDNDGTVATREPTLLIDDGTTPHAAFAAQSNVGINGLVFFSWATTGDNSSTGGGYFTESLQNILYMLAGHRVRTTTSALQAGDNWGAPQYLVEEWIEA